MTVSDLAADVGLGSGSAYRQVSRQLPQSQYRPVSAYRVAPGVTPPAAKAMGHSGPSRGGTGNRTQNRAHTQRTGSTAGVAAAGMTDISVNVRLIGAFVLVAVMAMATSFVTGMQLDAAQAALPDTLQEAQRRAILDNLAGVRTLAQGFGAATALLAVVLGAVIAVSVVRPIQRITHAMTGLAAGDTDTEVPARRAADELGAMARTIATFKETAIENQRLMAEREAERAREAEQRQAFRARLSEDLDASVNTQVAAARAEVDRLRTLSTEMMDAQGEASRTAGELGGAAQRAGELAASFANAVEDLSGAITDIEQRVEQTSQMSDQAAEDARVTDADITALVAAADSITQIIDLINDIAGKTNMLALNATVEAVRAGEAGKSFQVVAHEIKNLSRQTADATKQVEGHIGDIRAKTDHTAKRVRGILEVIGMINQAATDIQGAVEQQSRTAQQISQDARDANTQTQTMREGVAAVAARTDQTETAANKVQDGVQAVGAQIETLHDEVDTFLARTQESDESDDAGESDRS